eukprot:GHVL01009299.1.p1 GENE.GHVL01009299.1~~GHVL01009299.1.p1  ORF type:complete len:146 (+),score=18.56 GHVL01009299.1:140-577(+)
MKTRIMVDSALEQHDKNLQIPMAASNSEMCNPLKTNKCFLKKTDDTIISSSYEKFKPTKPIPFYMKLHNRFNMIVLPVLMALAFRDLYLWKSDIYTQLVVVLYFTMDTLWILAQPSIVKDPRAIGVHHIACAFLVLTSMVGRCRW